MYRMRNRQRDIKDTQTTKPQSDAFLLIHWSAEAKMAMMPSAFVTLRRLRVTERHRATGWTVWASRCFWDWIRAWHRLRGWAILASAFGSLMFVEVVWLILGLDAFWKKAVSWMTLGMYRHRVFENFWAFHSTVYWNQWRIYHRSPITSEKMYVLVWRLQWTELKDGLHQAT